MIGHHLKLSLRLLARNRFYASTSILGLTFGLTIAILILLFVKFELSFERWNPLADNIVRITMDYLNGDMVVDQDAGMYHPAGPRIKAEFKGVKDFTRVYTVNSSNVKAGTESLRENNLIAVDPSFLTMFNCNILAGKKEGALSGTYELLLTKSTALKYFGTIDALGQSVLISDFNQPFNVTGILADPPANTHLKYNALISQSTIDAKVGSDRLNWDNNNDYTYIQLSDADQYPSFVEQINALNKKLYSEGQIPNERIIAQPVTDIHLYSHKSYELEQNGDAIAVYFLMGVGLLVIIIAIVNHINLSTAKSLERAKEVAVRKVIGSSINQIRAQFFSESLLINVVSGVLAVGVVVASLPLFRNLAGLPADFHSWTDPTFYGIVTAVVALTTLLSCIFPSFILASFHPMKALRGKFSRTEGGVYLRKVLVTVQFGITMFLLVQTYTAKQQLDYMRAKDLGVDVEQTVVVRTSASGEASNYQVFKDKLLSQGSVQSVSFSGCVPGQPTSEMASTNVGVTLVGGATTDSYNFYITWLDADFLSTMKIDLATGRDFVPTDNGRDNILVNEEAIRLWNIRDAKEAIGQKINLWGSQRTIIGVVDNFHQASPKDPYLPMIFFHQEGSNKMASVRINSGNVTSDIDLIRKTYESVFPGTAFEYFFLDEQFDRQYRADEQFEKVFGLLTVFALLISALGLFGLVSVDVANRTKEIGVRKVLGATSQQIIGLISKDFVGLVLLSVTASAVLTYFVVKHWLDRYAFRIDLSAALFILPGVVIVALSLLAIVVRTLRVSLENPVRSLKED
ncbi:ABC transporter permease [Chryseolinea sp. T2]|uniref:ABC transporter permease n=1 Tax=Chryseolinea sp. T2 TaxID=3129255 RepID=UPI0030773990